MIQTYFKVILYTLVPNTNSISIENIIKKRGYSKFNIRIFVHDGEVGKILQECTSNFLLSCFKDFGLVLKKNEML